MVLIKSGDTAVITSGVPGWNLRNDKYDQGGDRSIGNTVINMHS